MITRDLSLPALNTGGDKVENKAKVENKVKVEKKERLKKKAKVKRKTPAEMTMIKVEQDGMPIHRCDVKVKVEEYNKVKVEILFPGAKANLADLPTGTGQLKLGKNQMAKRHFFLVRKHCDSCSPCIVSPLGELRVLFLFSPKTLTVPFCLWYSTSSANQPSKPFLVIWPAVHSNFIPFKLIFYLSANKFLAYLFLI
jgi:hypothetical protein